MTSETNLALSSKKIPRKDALVVCDMQYDFIMSIEPESCRMAWIDTVQMSIHAAKQAHWPILFSALEFKSGYQGVPPNHKLYGAFQRLNSKMGDERVHWFMEGYSGSEILSSLLAAATNNDSDDTRDECTIIRRQQHLPPLELMEILCQYSITNVTVIGCKAGYKGFEVSVVRECIQDDDKSRLDAIMTQLIPIYANVISLVDFMDETVNLEVYIDQPKDTSDAKDFDSSLVKYCCDCGRGGHAALYMFHLLQRPEWQVFPRQQWYVDFLDTYFCPLGERVVEFCDEPQFSNISMYLKGREWLDEKEKLVELAGNYIPDTFLIRNRQWVGETPVVNADDDSLCWFVKDANKNGGRAVQVCHTLSECMNLTEPDETYVVQRHIANPLLTDDGRKCHIKFYSLLVCNETAVWTLYTYKDAFLSVSPNPWSPFDVSKQTQITVKRTKRLKFGQEEEEWQNHPSAWPAAYECCQNTVADIVEKAIQQGKLQSRLNKKQFEIFSADFMLDTSGKLWVIEFNASPVLYDSSFANEDNLTTPGLKRYHELYLQQGDKAEVNDSAMICDAVSIVFYDSKGLSETTKWESAASFSAGD